MQNFKNLLLNNGFKEKLQTPDFSRHDDWAFYCERQIKQINNFPLWEYILLVYSNEGKFLEVVYESYIAKKDTYLGKGNDQKGEKDLYSKFQKMGKKPILTTIYRDYNDLKSRII